MTQPTKSKSPRDLKPGDVFRGPHGMGLVRVVDEPTPGKYSAYRVPVVRVDPTEIVTLEYNAQIPLEDA